MLGVWMRDTMRAGLQQASESNLYNIIHVVLFIISLFLVAFAAAIIYVVRFSEKVAENNALITDADGQPVYDLAVTRDGEPVSAEAFEAAYSRLLLVTASGALPEGWTPAEAPHSRWTYVTRTGVTHSIALSAFDAFHDAVTVDGQTLFYLVKGGLPRPEESGEEE